MNILIIAYLFPPDSSSGSFRPLHFAQYLNTMGEKVYVLTACEEDFLPHQTKDYKLLADLDENISILRSRVFHPRESLLGLRDKLSKKPQAPEKPAATYDKHGVVDSATTSWKQQLKDTITDVLALPDTEIGWLPSAIKAGRTIIKENNVDVIYVTGGPWTSLLIASLLKKLTGRPLVLDFRDPWVANPIFLIKTKFSRKIETFLERKVVKAADHIIANTEELRKNFLNRYAFLSPDQLTTITNGFEDYIELDETDKTPQFTILHAGTLIFRNPRHLLQAAINLVKQNVIQREELRIVFLGGISMQDPELDKVLAHPILANILEVLPRVPYLEAVKYQKKSNVLFLMQPEEFPLQIPRKLYEYIAFRKPIFAITNSESATAKIIQENHLGIVVPDHLQQIESALQALYMQWKENTIELPPATTSDQFMNKQLTIKLRKILQTCSF